MAAASCSGWIYFFGGVGGRGTESILDIDQDFWRFEPETFRWERLDQVDARPAARRCCGFVGWDRRLALWGGSGVATVDGRTGHTFLNDFWMFDPDLQVWQRLEASEAFRLAPFDHARRPGPRYTPVFQRVGSTLVLFGGYTEDRLGRRKLDDLWVWTEHRGWRQVEPMPQDSPEAAEWPGPRYGAMASADEHRLYVCGGAADDGDHIDLWVWDVATEQWGLLAGERTGRSVPERRYCAASAVHGGGFWLFGGRSRRDAKRNFNDTWRFDLSSRRWECVIDPADLDGYGPSSAHIGYHAKSAHAVVNDRWYLLGGEGLHGHVSDLWQFDFATAQWSLLSPARPDDPRFW